MGKSDHNKNNDERRAPREGAVAARDNGEQVPLPFFETVMSPTMTAEPTVPAAAQPAHTDTRREGLDTDVRASDAIAPDDADTAAVPAPVQEAQPEDARAPLAGAQVHEHALEDADVLPAEDADAGTHDCAQHASELRPAVAVSESLGQRLRAAREARGMRCEEAAQQMKLPLATVHALEADCYDRIGDGIYLR